MSGCNRVNGQLQHQCHWSPFPRAREKVWLFGYITCTPSSEYFYNSSWFKHAGFTFSHDSLDGNNPLTSKLYFPVALLSFLIVELLKIRILLTILSEPEGPNTASALTLLFLSGLAETGQAVRAAAAAGSGGVGERTRVHPGRGSWPRARGSRVAANRRFAALWGRELAGSWDKGAKERSL